MTRHLFWTFAVLVSLAPLCHAWAEDGELTAPTIVIQHRKIVELEKRIQDLEVNMQAQIAKPCACTAPAAAATNESEEHHKWCVTRFSKQLSGTNATPEQYDRAVTHCDGQWKIWERRDP